MNTNTDINNMVIDQEPAPINSAPKHPLLILGIALFLVGAILLSMFVFSHLSSGSDYCFYTKDNKIMCFDFQKGSSFEVIDITPYPESDAELDTNFSSHYANINLSYYLRVSQNKDYVFFTTQTSDDTLDIPLFYRSLKNWKSEPVQITASATKYHVNENADLVTFLSAGTLSQYNMNTNETIEISKNVEIFRVSHNGTFVFLANRNGNVCVYSPEKGLETIHQENTGITYVKELENAFYYVMGSSLYKVEKGNPATKIVDGAYYIASDIYPSGEFCYFKKAPKTFTRLDFIDDDLKAVDATLPKPSAQSSRKEKEAYAQKQKRDELRKELADSTLIKYQLYYFDGTQEHLLNDAHIDQLTDWNCLSQTEPMFLYAKFNLEKHKKPKMSELSAMESDDFWPTFNSTLSECVEHYFLYQNKSTPIPGTHIREAGSYKDNQTIYFVDWKLPTNLYTMEIVNGSPQKPILYQQGVSEFETTTYGNHLVYYTEHGDSDTPLYTLHVDQTKVDENVETMRKHYDETTDTLYYITYQKHENKYSLKKFQNNTSTLIHEQVYDYYVASNNEVLYHCYHTPGDDRSENEIYLYKNKRSTKIDSNISTFLFANDDSYGGSPLISSIYHPHLHD